ncbi:MAG: SRPBCC family protein [Limnohabitans sp.]
MSHTVRFQRVLRAPAERVYRAFIDPDAMCKWLPPHGFTGRVHAMDARVGGGYRMSFTNLANGQSHSFGGTFLELVPGQRIVHTDRFDDPGLPGDMVTTLTFRTTLVGTEVNIEQAGIPDPIPPEACCLGWQESLQLLALLVEAEIPA